MQCLQMRGAPAANRRRLLERSAPLEVPLFPLPEVDDVLAVDSFCQSAYDVPVLHVRARVRFPWPEDAIDLSNIATQLPVNMVRQPSDGTEGVGGYGEDLFDLLTDLPISVSETLLDPSEDLLSFSEFSSTQVHEQSTDEALSEANKQATSQLKEYLDQPKDACKPKTNILHLPGEVLNIVFSHLTEPADYEIKWLKRGSYLTHWRYRVPRASLDKHTQHSACKRIRKPNGGESCWDWRADHHWDPMFTRQWQRSSVSHENTIPRRAKFRASYRRFAMTSASADTDTGTPTELDYVSGDTAWLMVCRRFYEAGTSLFYANKSFSISGHHLFSKFLSNLTPQVRPWLHHLYLYHEAPGEPKSRADVQFRDKDNARWIETCKKGAAVLSGLTTLEVYIILKPCPPYLDMSAPWVEGLLEWGTAPALQNFNLYIRAGPIETDKNRLTLRMTKHRIRRAVLGAEHWQNTLELLRQRVSADPLVKEMLRAEIQVLEWEADMQEAALRRKEEVIGAQTGLWELNDDEEDDEWDAEYLRRRAVLVANELARPARTLDR